ncbi:MAG: TlpA family protein disulfide reductase [Spirochaetae bacterium HGW-Spirochaetae-7]|jgi:thiol-disulfide isomerase/thioredoxin|nr:MAG: TlpA family protein disulfide reductase [Spirochaetae bacterium HGW-Spirochaetae-7]
MKKPYKAVTLTVVALVALSCSRPEPVSPPRAAAPAGISGIAEASISNAPWYAERFEKLGFYVFPSPEPLPPVSVLSLKGVQTSVADKAGKVVLLNFWATWCPPCRTEMPSIQVLSDKLKGAAFEVMAISVAEKPGTVAGFLKENPYSYPMYLDESGAASAPFASRGIPTTFVLDKQGRAIAGLVGARSYDGPEVLALFRELAERLP